jgi:hypothetical protein
MIFKNIFFKPEESNSFIEWFETENPETNFVQFEDDKLSEKIYDKLVDNLPVFLDFYQSIGIYEIFSIIKVEKNLVLSEFLKPKIKSKFEKSFFTFIALLNVCEKSCLSVDNVNYTLEPMQAVVIPEHSKRFVFSFSSLTYVLCSSVIYRDKNNMFIEFGGVADF